MSSYHSGSPIRTRSISEIARGKLHSYGIGHIPRNPYGYGSLRHLFRTSSIGRLGDSRELQHLKSERERKERELIEKLPTREWAYASTDKLKETKLEDQKPIEVDGRKFEVDAWNMNIVEKDRQTIIPFHHLETEERRKEREQAEKEARKIESKSGKDGMPPDILEIVKRHGRELDEAIERLHPRPKTMRELAAQEERKLEKEIDKDLEHKAKRAGDRRDDDLEHGGAEL